MQFETSFSSRKQKQGAWWIIGKQPVIFDITYTPYKLKSNATQYEIQKHKDERSFYNMSGDKNVYNYVTTERKRVAKEVHEKTFYEYLQKSTGVFNKNGMINKEEVKKMKARLQDGEKNIWHGFISFDEDNSYKINEIARCVHLINETFDDFFIDAGFNKDNMDLMCSLHLDKPKHLHIHFIFWEKEPIIKNKRAKGYLYRAKGKIPYEAIKKMQNKLDNYEVPYKLTVNENQTIDYIKEIKRNMPLFYRDNARSEIRKLANKIEYYKDHDYADSNMLPYRDKIDKIVEYIALSNDDLGISDFIIRDAFFKEDLKSGNNKIFFTSDVQNKKEVKDITNIKNLEWSYKRRLGNIVIKQVYDVKFKSFSYNKYIRRKRNDKSLKKSISISESIIKRSFNKFFNSVIDLFTQENMIHTNRLKEIEEEMKEAKLQEQQAEEENYYDRIRRELNAKSNSQNYK